MLLLLMSLAVLAHTRWAALQKLQNASASAAPLLLSHERGSTGKNYSQSPAGVLRIKDSLLMGKNNWC